MKDTPEKIHEVVRDHYADRVKSASACCGPESSCGCQGDLYPAELLSTLPDGEVPVSFGCGDPISLASLEAGQTVLDLGSGAGLDCFFAAGKVGSTGHVIGIDMTPEMLERARSHAERLGLGNVEFREGLLERLPVEDASVDVVISNCVINLAPDKRPVYTEAFRVLKSGGRLAISDVVATGPVPEDIRKDALLWSQCAAGAMDVKDLETLLDEIGFNNIRITPKESSREMIRKWNLDPRLECFVSADIQAVKP